VPRYRYTDAARVAGGPSHVNLAGDDAMKIGMIGFRGIPHTYSGNEDFVRELAPRLADRGHEVTVYCRSGLFTDRTPIYLGVRRVFLPTIEHKSGGMFIHATLAAMAALRDRVDIVYIHTLPSAPHALLPWLLRRPIVINMDGLEWQRDKWGMIGKMYFKMARNIALFAADKIVNDSEVLRQYYLEHFGRDSAFIAYGAEIEYSRGPAAIGKWGLRADDYYLIASRLVPENNADKIINAYKRIMTERPLVIAGSANYSSPWLDRVRAEARDRVRLIGHVGNPRDVIELHCNCYAYIHGHTVGGTNPSLVKALGCGNCIAAFASPFNREVLTGRDAVLHGELFADEDELACILQRFEDQPELVESYRARAQNRVREAYTWEQITDGYEAVFHEVVERRARRSAS
jgi:glycosyltransferase involved in cell wall biosynthesis